MPEGSGVASLSSQDGITSHTNLLNALIANQDEKVSKKHCKGMEGLVNEAVKHTIEDAPDKGPVLDAAIIPRYQRMTHYGLTGFGTVAAFSRALKLKDDYEQRAVAPFEPPPVALAMLERRRCVR